MNFQNTAKMRSRHFIISVLLAGWLPVMACGPWEPIAPEKHWIFYLGYPAAGEWQQALDKQFREENISFWHNYVGQAVPRKAVEEALYEVVLLDGQTQNPFFKLLISKADTDALLYWMHLKTCDPRYEKEMRWKQSAWWHPASKEEKEARYDSDPARPQMDLSIIKIMDLNEECLQKCSNRDIRNRLLLQLMRKYFHTARYEKCEALWKKYGKQLPHSALRTQCLNYYGGALLRLGRKTEAAVVYAQIGYFNLYLHYDPEVLREVTRHQPNNSGLEFMVQQFVNCYSDRSQPAKAEAFHALAEEMVRNREVRNPALWRSAQAAIAYINRNTDKALQLIAESEKLRGSAKVKENIRMMRLLFNASRTDNDSLYEATLLPDLEWLTGNINADLREIDTTNRSFFYDFEAGLIDPSSYLELHRVKVFRRVIFLGAVPHFERVGQPYKSIAYLNLYHEVYDEEKRERELARKGLVKSGQGKWGWTIYWHPPLYCGTTQPYDYYDDYWAGWDKHFWPQPEKRFECYTGRLNYDYGCKLFRYMDTTKLDNVLQYAAFLRSGGATPAEKYLIRNSYCDTNYYNELIGTKYMRKGQYATAIRYLQQVSDTFRKTQNIYPWLNSSRNPFAEHWITNKEKGVYNTSFDPVKAYAQNPCKLNFCRIMLRLRHESEKGRTEAERAHAAYAYAVGLFQSNNPHAWALNHYADNSIIFSDDDDLNPCYGSYYELDVAYTAWRKAEKKRMQQQVDWWADKALAYQKEKLFTLKCRILHSRQREQLTEKVVRKNYWGDYTETRFKREVRMAFCDRWEDYE